MSPAEVSRSTLILLMYRSLHQESDVLDFSCDSIDKVEGVREVLITLKPLILMARLNFKPS